MEVQPAPCYAPGCCLVGPLKSPKTPEMMNCWFQAAIVWVEQSKDICKKKHLENHPALYFQKIKEEEEEVDLEKKSWDF